MTSFNACAITVMHPLLQSRLRWTTRRARIDIFIGSCVAVGNRNRKATKDEMTRVRRVIKEAFPDFEAVFGGHGDLGGHRAPRDHTICFRLRDATGRFRSNVIWLMPDVLSSLTADDISRLVGGKRRRKPSRR